MKRIISTETVPSPQNFHSDSKCQADKKISELSDEDFNVLVVRLPMIYERGSKGNYAILVKLAKQLHVFPKVNPKVNNERSMLHIDHLCEFLCQVMLFGKECVFFPQNAGYTNTVELIKENARMRGKRVATRSILNLAVFLGSKIYGRLVAS